jgi:hypothetical protein
MEPGKARDADKGQDKRSGERWPERIKAPVEASNPYFG